MSNMILTREQLLWHFDHLKSALIHNEFEKWKAVIIDSHANLLTKLEAAEQEKNTLKSSLINYIRNA